MADDDVRGRGDILRGRVEDCVVRARNEGG